MVQPSSTTPGITNPTITSSGTGSHAQQAFDKQQTAALSQNDANLAAMGGSKLKGSKNKYRGGASNTIALAPMQPGTPASQVAVNASVQQTGANSAAKAAFDCHASNSCPTTGGKKRSRTNKRKTRKTRRNHKKSKRRRSKSHRK